MIKHSPWHKKPQFWNAMVLLLLSARTDAPFPRLLPVAARICGLISALDHATSRCVLCLSQCRSDFRDPLRFPLALPIRAVLFAVAVSFPRQTSRCWLQPWHSGIVEPIHCWWYSWKFVLLCVVAGCLRSTQRHSVPASSGIFETMLWASKLQE